jgi:hypothetical protein
MPNGNPEISCSGTRYSHYVGLGLRLYSGTMRIFCSTDFAMVVNEPVIGGLAVPVAPGVAIGYNCTNHAKGL